MIYLTKVGIQFYNNHLYFAAVQADRVVLENYLRQVALTILLKDSRESLLELVFITADNGIKV